MNKFLRAIFLVLFFSYPLYVEGQVIISDLLSEANRLEIYADSCFKVGDINSAFAAYSESLEIRKDYQGLDSEQYAKTLYHLSRCLAEKAEYSEALKLSKEVLEIQKNVLGESSSDYIATLNNIAINNAELGNYTEAIKIGNEALTIAKEAFGSNSLDCASSLVILSWAYSCIGDNLEAIRLISEALEIQKNALGINNPEYAKSLSYLALYKYNIGNISEAIELESEATEIRKKNIGNKHPDFATSLDNLATYYISIGEYIKALELGSEALNIRKNLLGSTHDEYAISLINVATINAYLGNYIEAEKLALEGIEVLKKKSNNSIFYIAALNLLSSFNLKLGNYEKSRIISKEALKTIEINYGRENYMCSSVLSNIAETYFNTENYNQALSYAFQAVEISKNTQGDNHPDYAWHLSFLAKIYYEMHNYDESIRLESEALEIVKNDLGENSIDYFCSLFSLAKNNLYLKNYTLATKDIVASIDINTNHLLNNFKHLSSSRRRYLWDKESSFFLEEIPKFAYYIKNSVLISTLFDKSALLSKGILLNTEIEMKNLIEESGDSALIEEYKMIRSNYEIYVKQSNLPIAERIIDIDSLNNVIQKQEDDLVNKSQAYGDYMRNLKLSWKDIQQSLGDDDIAIEFLDFPVGKDSIMYVALTLKKEYDNPKMITLFEHSQLKGIQENAYYRSSRLATLVWKPLEEELVGAKNVYFSPSGELHKIGIEYLPLNQDEYIFDKYQLHRLSSTRQIVIDKKRNNYKHAVVYGGIDYDSLQDIVLYEENSSNKVHMSLIDRVQVDSLNVRGSRDYLEGTKIEADSIVENLKQHRWNFDYYTGVNGTEESFKILSGRSPSVLHIATHGFYMTEEDARIDRELAKLESDKLMNDFFVMREDKPMTRSGLLMAGCNHVLNHEEIPENVEDGILTAQEIASLDLRGLDLVVLSACETGLGDIASGEGVFGLQRGFKKAGANTIIMSLWKVSDKATEKLMTTFYQYYLNGMSKYDAFAKAREEVRKNSSPRQIKPDWAAFIMLDGIN